MSIKSLVASQAGLVGTVPTFIYIFTNDTYSDVLTPGYLKDYASQVGPNNAALVETTDEGVTILKVVNNAAGPSLQAFSTSGIVVDLPTDINHIATYANTDGALFQDATIAINGGSLQAGLSGTAGSLISFPATSAKGSLVLSATNNTGNFVTTISNAQQGQATTYSIPDSGQTATNFLLSDFAGTQQINTGSVNIEQGNFVVASGTITAANGNIFATLGTITAGSNGHVSSLIVFPGPVNTGSFVISPTSNSGNFITTLSNNALGQNTTFNLPNPTNAVGQILVAATATPFTSGNLIQASGTVGVTSDSGIATSNVQLKSNIKSAITGNIGGAGAGPLTVNVTGMTSASTVNVTVRTASNPCYVASAVSGSGSFALTMSADPGATLTVQYIVALVAQ